MKIKDGQKCITFSTPTFWMRCTRGNYVGALYDPAIKFTQKVFFLRLEALQSELLKGLAK